uniref:SFRICE_038121 n=1 Tax=Spodoptera frugiperda TaxID=7108 RepID=A0A2H1VLG3_SPOFR
MSSPSSNSRVLEENHSMASLTRARREGVRLLLTTSKTTSFLLLLFEPEPRCGASLYFVMVKAV